MRTLEAEPDHVAVAVPDFDVADARWRDELGGRWSSWYHRKGLFRSRQLRYRNGAKLELIQPSETDPSEDNFVRRFLDRHGSEVHHLTLKVPALRPAVEIVSGAGLDVVDVDDTSSEYWHEAFLRPSQIGGIVVQLAWAKHSDEDWAELHDFEPETPPRDGAELEGVLLRHPDLDRARVLWTVLGAQVTADAGGLMCRWGAAPLTVRVVPASPEGPMGLRFAGTEPLPPSPAHGTAVIPA